MIDYRAYSFWLETCGDDLTPRPPLDGSIDVDVAILGAGFSGLWTAYELLKRDPSLKVAVLEQHIAGYGASGRNGGGLGNRFPLGLRELERRFGHEGALAVHQALDGTIDEIASAAEAEGIAMDFVRGGYLRLARGQHQLAAVENDYRTFEAFGLADGYELLDAQATAERVSVNGALAALSTKNSAKIHPAKLARGLARAVERRGGTIYERTPVTGWTGGAYPALHTERGHARAKTIVLAGEAYLSRFPSMRRKVMPVYSLISLTEPLSPAEWQQIGWEAREGLSSAALMVNYLTRTADGRVLFGGRGEPYHYASQIRDAYDRDAATHQLLQDQARDWFPLLKNVAFTHAWGGPLGWPRDYLPRIGYDPKEGIATAYGYTGTGVAPANLAGRILADLITRRDSAVARLPFVNATGRSWEPEPLRWLGVRYVQRGFEQVDHRAEATGLAPNGTSIAERLARH